MTSEANGKEQTETKTVEQILTPTPAFGGAPDTGLQGGPNVSPFLKDALNQ